MEPAFCLITRIKFLDNFDRYSTHRNAEQFLYRLQK